MRRTFVAILTIVASLALAAAGLADPGDKGKVKKHTKLTISTVTTDHGSCGNVWASDTLQRTLIVQKRNNGSYTVTRRDRGTFATLAGQSPGACDTTGKHGHLIVAGVRGTLQGYVRGTVTGGTFDPEATCNAVCASTTPTLIAAYFGAGAQFSCFTNSSDCKFNFNYTAKASGNPKLLYRHWQDKGKGAGSMLKEAFSGDIAVS
jgi:hypothetical protein